MTEKIESIFAEADMILIGLGEDFNDIKRLQKDEPYQEGKKALLENDLQWLVPAWEAFCSSKLEDIITPALEKLSAVFGKKNYFVIATATDGRVAEHNWKNGWMVMPCGYPTRKQCAEKCEKQIETEDAAAQSAELGATQLYQLTTENEETLKHYFEELYAGNFYIPGDFNLGKCPDCGANLILNTVYSPNYAEIGYMDQWNLYKKWLTGTINKKLVLLELGVGLQFPSVIRWPFEKMAYYNQKSTLVRVNEKLYQLTDNLEGRGVSVPENAVEWLLNL